MAVTPLNASRPPEASELLGEIGRGVIPGVEHVVAAVEAYPGPTPDWRSLLVTETLREALPTLGIRRGESAVIAPRNASAKEMLRYQRNGWRPYRMDDLMVGVLGDKDYRRCLAKAAPRQRQAQVKKMLAEMSAPNSAMWPVMRTLDAFYRSDDDMPSKKHLSGWARNEDDVVRWAGMLWEKQRNDPIGSGLGLPREAMPKYWQHRHGGVWPELPPDLPPKLIVVANAEELTPSELRLLARQPCPVLCFGDPAVGAQGASPETLNTLPLGSSVLGELHATTLGCEAGLERAIRHVIRNDVEIPDAWTQTVGALSAVTLGRERPGFTTYRQMTHTPRDMPHHPPLASPDARPGAIISRTGVSAIRHLLDAMRPERRLPPDQRPHLKIHMDAEFSQLVKDAHEVAQLYYLPEDQWERNVAQRYRKGRDAALDMCAKSPTKAAFLDLFRQREDPALAGVLKLIGNIEFRGSRVIHASGLKDADQANGHETTLHIGDPPDLRGLKGEPVTIVEAELGNGGSGQAQAACLYRVLAQRPVQISHASEEAIEFLERAHDWLAVKRAPGEDMPEVGGDQGKAPRASAAAPKADSAPAPDSVSVNTPGQSPAQEPRESPPGSDRPAEEAVPDKEADASPAPGGAPKEENRRQEVEPPPSPPESPSVTEADHPAEPASAGATPNEGPAPQGTDAPGAAGAEHQATDTATQRRESPPPLDPEAYSAPDQPVPPALSDWAHDVFDDARMHEAALESDELEAALWEYHQPDTWADQPAAGGPEEGGSPSERSDPPASTREPEQAPAIEEGKPTDTHQAGDPGMNGDMPDEGKKKQAELQSAWGAAAEGILKRKAAKENQAPKPFRGPSPGA